MPVCTSFEKCLPIFIKNLKTISVLWLSSPISQQAVLSKVLYRQRGFLQRDLYNKDLEINLMYRHIGEWWSSPWSTQWNISQQLKYLIALFYSIKRAYATKFSKHIKIQNCTKCPKTQKTEKSFLSFFHLCHPNLRWDRGWSTSSCLQHWQKSLRNALPKEST